jgi:hypothetical protein
LWFKPTARVLQPEFDRQRKQGFSIPLRERFFALVLFELWRRKYGVTF